MSGANIKRVLITGGAGYVGSALTPRLLAEGYEVCVLDLYLYHANPLASHPRLQEIRGDLRDRKLLDQVLSDCDAVIHLACVSNDPSFELDPQLGKSINYDAFAGLVDASREAGAKRFVYASSSSVYGIKAEPNVTEDLPLQPLTDYSKYKALCEDLLQDYRRPGFTTLTVRPATVCGYATRLRLDLCVNILTNHALTNGLIKVFGGTQLRPNIHINDMVEFYVQSLRWEDEKIDGKTYNVGYENLSIDEIAECVRGVVGKHVEIERTPTDDLRSYHVSSEKVQRELGFTAQHSIRDAIVDLVKAFKQGKVPDSMTDSQYYNIRVMQELGTESLAFPKPGNRDAA